MTESAPIEEHDLAGLRENFTPRTRWRSAINGAIAMGRLQRAGTNRSERERITRAMTDVSDGEKSTEDSAGWRSPERPGTPTEKRSTYSNKGSLGVGDVGEGKAPVRTLSADVRDEEYDNVLVHPPEDDKDGREGDKGKEMSERPEDGQTQTDLQTRPQPQSPVVPPGHTLKREDESPHPADIHALPEVTSDLPHKSQNETKQGQANGAENDNQNEVKSRQPEPPRFSVEDERLAMPGSFHIPSSRRADDERHDRGESGGEGNGNGRGRAHHVEHALAHFLRRLGLHHRNHNDR